MSLPIKPMIDEAVLVRGGERPYAAEIVRGVRGHRLYKGPINPGDVFAWEPDLPHARELVVVTRITGPGEDQTIEHALGVAVLSGGHEQRVWTRPLDGDEEVWNDESRFREAVVPTLFNPHPVNRWQPGDPLARR